MTGLKSFPGRFIAMMDRWIHWLWTDAGLTIKIATIMLIGLLVLMGSFSYLGISATRDSTQQTLQERVTMAQLAANHLDSVLSHIEQMMRSAAEHLIPVDEEPALIDRARLYTAYQQLRGFSRQVFLLNSHGQVILAEPPAPQLDPLLLAAVPSVADTLQTGRFALSGAAHPISTKSSKGPTVLASVPIQDVEGAVTGALVAHLDLTRPDFNDFLQPIALGQTGYMEVVDDQGIILLSTNPDHLLRQSDHKGNLATMIQAGQALVATCHDCHRTPGDAAPLPEVMAFAPLNQATWGVVIRQHETEALATARKLQARVLSLGGMALLVALGLIWLATRSIVMPLRLLTGAASRMAQGDLDTPIHFRRGDEIGILTKTFDGMRVRLREFTKEIQTWNRELDRRVHERTRACLAAQAEAQQARKDLQGIIDGLTDELVVVDRELRVLQANAVVRERWGETNPIVGQACWVVNHEGNPCQPPSCICPVQSVFETGTPVRVTHFHPHRQDKGRYVDIVASPLYDQTGRIRGVIELLRDVTEETQIKQALVRRNEELSALNVVAGTVSQTLDLTEILEKALEAVLALSGIDAGSIFLSDVKSGELELMVQRGPSPDWQTTTTPPDAIIHDRTQDPILEKKSRHSLVQVPLVAKGVTLGLMCLETDHPRQFAEEELSLLGALGRQIAVGVENARLYADIQQKDQLRGQLLKTIITAQEEERKRIARELHDETSQALTALAVGLETIIKSLTMPTETVKEQLISVKSLVGEVMRELQRVILDLRPAILDDLGLALAVDWYAERRLKSHKIQVGLETVGAERRLPSEVETTVFRIAQEAITNISRHAQAENVSLELEFTDSTIGLTIEDDGCGFVPELMMARGKNNTTFGLLGMKERAALFGGTLVVQSQEGQGTTISVEIPLKGAVRHEDHTGFAGRRPRNFKRGVEGAPESL